MNQAFGFKLFSFDRGGFTVNFDEVSRLVESYRATLSVAQAA
jgi:hypothetical protein